MSQLQLRETGMEYSETFGLSLGAAFCFVQKTYGLPCCLHEMCQNGIPVYSNLIQRLHVIDLYCILAFKCDDNSDSMLQFD
jgi:hypothetical protein